MKTKALLCFASMILILACTPVTINIGQPAPTASLPDLTVTSSIISMVDVNGNCLPGYEVTAYVLNQGSVPAENVVVQEFVTGHQVLIGTLGAGQSMAIQFPAGSPTGRYLIFADPEGAVTESDETNNKSVPSLPAATPPSYCMPYLPVTPTPTPFDAGMYTPPLPQSDYFPMFTAPAFWITHSQPYMAYQIQVPPDAIITDQSERVVIGLPFAVGTQMIEKSIRIETRMATAEECWAQFPWEGITFINGVEVKYSGGKVWQQGLDNLSFFGGDYAVHRNGICYRLYMFMGVQNAPGTPLPAPSRADLDYSILLNILSTFRVP